MPLSFLHGCLSTKWFTSWALSPSLFSSTSSLPVAGGPAHRCRRSSRNLVLSLPHRWSAKLRWRKDGSFRASNLRQSLLSLQAWELPWLWEGDLHVSFPSLWSLLRCHLYLSWINGCGMIPSDSLNIIQRFQSAWELLGNAESPALLGAWIKTCIWIRSGVIPEISIVW